MWLSTRALPISCALLIALGAAPSTAAAAVAVRSEPATEQARRLHRQGAEHFAKGRLRQAIAAFERGHRLVPRPEFLLNLAQCHRGLGQRQRAIHYLRRFLAEASRRHRLRKAAVHTLAELERAAPARSPSAPSPSAPSPSASSPSTRPDPKPAGAGGARRDGDGLGFGVAALPLVGDPPPRRPPRRRPSRRWKWILIGAGVVATATAVALGVYLGGRDDGQSDLGTISLPPR